MYVSTQTKHPPVVPRSWISVATHTINFRSNYVLVFYGSKKDVLVFSFSCIFRPDFSFVDTRPPPREVWKLWKPQSLWIVDPFFFSLAMNATRKIERTTSALVNLSIGNFSLVCLFRFFWVWRRGVEAYLFYSTGWEIESFFS